VGEVSGSGWWSRSPENKGPHWPGAPLAGTFIPVGLVHLMALLESKASRVKSLVSSDDPSQLALNLGSFGVYRPLGGSHQDRICQLVKRYGLPRTSVIFVQRSHNEPESSLCLNGQVGLTVSDEDSERVMTNTDRAGLRGTNTA
jgi:hypothetical protein